MVRAMTDSSTRICPWCSTSIPAGAAACPKCGAAVEGATVAEIPGVTVADPKASFDRDEGLIPAGLQADESAFEPPSEAVRLEMRKMQLEAEIANAGGAVMNPRGDEAISVGRPSNEAIEALEAGLLDETALADEVDPAEPTAG
jgi:hypothetical protein